MGGFAPHTSAPMGYGSYQAQPQPHAYGQMPQGGMPSHPPMSHAPPPQQELFKDLAGAGFPGQSSFGGSGSSAPSYGGPGSSAPSYGGPGSSAPSFGGPAPPQQQHGMGGPPAGRGQPQATNPFAQFM
eukprot:NODE_2266_length_495_cov_143.500000_g2249_i0.p1 GENE.NODE_2266_length_495_cov_143.500000_g2249_i0~~NODE_2266_length_495_cov_143.500000_g2249_i0.p1  ORF type:complete len:128 (-),score=11.29 NODE_2266_length_495_cov_143.500000_g2249_i0:76-459(-)